MTDQWQTRQTNCKCPFCRKPSGPTLTSTLITQDTSIICTSCIKKEEQTNIDNDAIKVKTELEPGEVPQGIKQETVEAKAAPLPTAVFHISGDRLKPDTVYKRVLTLAAQDEALVAVLAAKQGECRKLQRDFEERKKQLQTAKLGDREYRLALFRLQEKLLSATANVQQELIDRLKSLQVFGFEALKVLAGDSQHPPHKEVEVYLKAQKEAAGMLLTLNKPFDLAAASKKTYDLIPKKKQKGMEPQPSMGSALLSPLSKT